MDFSETTTSPTGSKTHILENLKIFATRPLSQIYQSDCGQHGDSHTSVRIRHNHCNRKVQGPQCCQTAWLRFEQVRNSWAESQLSKEKDSNYMVKEKLSGGKLCMQTKNNICVTVSSNMVKGQMLWPLAPWTLYQTWRLEGYAVGLFCRLCKWKEDHLQVLETLKSSGVWSWTHIVVKQQQARINVRQIQTHTSCVKACGLLRWKQHY